MSALAGEVTVARDESGVVHLGGVQRCGSAWACPVCAPVVRERRAREIDAGVAAHLDAGGHAYFVTVTVSHSLGEDLASVLQRVTAAWSGMFSGRAAQAWAQSTGYIGQVRAVEVTYGANGWHPHIHALLLFDRPWSYSRCDRPSGSMADEWARQVERQGGYAAVAMGGPGFRAYKVRTVSELAGYLTKVSDGWSAGHEVARTDVKSARREGSLAPFGLLDLAAQVGDELAARLWHEYEQATAGRASVQWSRGLKARLGIDEVSDEEAAAAQVDGVLLIVATFTAAVWEDLLRRGRVARIIEACSWPDSPPPG